MGLAYVDIAAGRRYLGSSDHRKGSAMYIEFVDISQLAEIVAGLAKQNLRFEASPKGDYWIIVIKGY